MNAFFPILTPRYSESNDHLHIELVQTLKLIDHLHATRWTFPDYWQSDNSNGLVMVIRKYHWLNSASRVLISTCSAPLVQMGERKQFSLFDLDLWPTTLTYNPRLAKVKVDPHAKKSRSKVKTVQIGECPQQTDTRTHTDKRTDTHTHKRYQTYYISLATWLIKIEQGHPIHAFFVKFSKQYFLNALTCMFYTF